MSLQIRIYNIYAPNPFRVFYKIGDTLDSEIDGFIQYETTFSGDTELVTISGITLFYNTTYWIKIQDVITNSYAIQNIFTQDATYFTGSTCEMEGFAVCNDCDLAGYVDCYVIPPSQTITPTPTKSIATSITPTPTITPTITATPTITPTPSTSPPTRYSGLRPFNGNVFYDTHYTTTVLSSGQCFCSGGGIKYVSSGARYDVTGLTFTSGTVLPSCASSCP